MMTFLRKRNDWIGEMGLVGAGLALHLWYLLHTTFVDWPEMILYPWFLTKGLLYYRDVVLAYVPGAYYLLFALYKLLGFSLQSERTIAYGFIFLADIFVYVVARKLTGHTWLAWVSLLFFILWQPILSGNTIWYETILTPIYLATYLLTLTYFKKPSVRSAWYVGLGLAGASLMKQTAVWSIGVVCLFLWLTHKNKAQGFRHVLLVGLLPVIANLLTWGYFAWRGAGREFGYWSYGFLLQLTQKTSYYIQPPTRTEIFLILPAFIPLFALILLRPKKEIWLLILWSLALFMAALPRWGIHRLQPMLAMASVSVSVFLKAVRESKRKNIVWVGLFACGLVIIGSWRSVRVFVAVRDSMQPQFFDARYRALLDFSRAHLDQPFYVLGNYDYIYMGLNRTPTVLPWVPLFPWNAEVPGVQQHIIASLEAQKVPYILYLPFHPDTGYYLDYVPQALLLYVSEKYEKIASLPIEGAWLMVRK